MELLLVLLVIRCEPSFINFRQLLEKIVCFGFVCARIEDRENKIKEIAYK